MAEKRKTVVAIASSAGGLMAMRDILAELPRDLPAPVILAQHRGDSSADVLVRLLSERAKLRVRVAAAWEVLSPGYVYLCPPASHVELKGARVLRAWEGPRINFVRPSCDLLFRSVAAHGGEGSVCVVLTGNGQDGAMGARQVRRAGGYVIAQDEATASYPGMPMSAVDMGGVDLVLPLEKIGFAVSTLVRERLGRN